MLMGYPAIQMAVDPDRISALLKEHLSPLQEKVVRLYFGLGCSRSFSATEIAREFQVSRQMISGIVSGAQTKLASVGLTPSLLVPRVRSVPVTMIARFSLVARQMKPVEARVLRGYDNAFALQSAVESLPAWAR